MGFDSNVFNVSNRALSNMDDLVVGELERTPAVIPSKSLGASAVIVEAAPAGGPGSAGAYEQLRQAIGGEPPCEPELSPHEQALRTNAEVETHNENLDKEIAELAEQERHLRKLFAHPLATGDGCLTYAELIDLSCSSDPELQEAATWLMGAFEVRHALPRKQTLFGGDRDFQETGFDDGGGIDIRASQSTIAQLARKRRELEGQYREPVEVPEATASDASAAGAGQAGGQATSVSSAASPTPVSTAASLEGALGNINDAISALQQEVIAESAKAKAGDSNAAQKLAELQARMQTLTAVASILSNMISNLAKLYSEMAMTSVRNMK